MTSEIQHQETSATKFIRLKEKFSLARTNIVVCLIKGPDRGKHLNTILRALGIPLLGIIGFLFFWQSMAPNINTSLGTVPGPAQVWEQFVNLIDEHRAERNKEVEFYQRQVQRFEERALTEPDAEFKLRHYTGKPTFFDQIITSILTVMSGFLAASLIAIPVGIIAGLSRGIYAAVNPLIQLFKPVSPLAWLPIVSMIVSAVYVSQDPMFSKSYINSMITVMLCCLWPTIINTIVGVSNVSRDLVNVSKVLRLSWTSHVMKIVLPSSIPMVFTGLRLSLSVAWMVLIATEMLAQNPGLGKFVWDEFQNGSSNSLGRIMVAVFVIGIIGFMLDRLMLGFQHWASWDKSMALR